MGPYCKFCNTRCFVPTTKDDYIKTDLKATCKEGIIFDMNKTYRKVSNDKSTWLISLNRGEEYSLFAELFNNSLLSFEVKNSEFEEIIDLTKAPNENLYYRFK